LDLSFPGASLHTGDVKAYKAIGDKAGITELIAQYGSSSANVVASARSLKDLVLRVLALFDLM
jgi:hypothetical protein